MVDLSWTLDICQSGEYSRPMIWNIDHQRESWFVASLQPVTTSALLTTFCPTFPETWRSDWLTTTLTDDTLLFPKQCEGRRSAVGSLHHKEILQHILRPVLIKQDKWCVSHYFFFQKEEKNPTQTQTRAQPKKKTTITAQETRCHVSSWWPLFCRSFVSRSASAVLTRWQPGIPPCRPSPGSLTLP